MVRDMVSSTPSKAEADYGEKELVRMESEWEQMEPFRTKATNTRAKTF